LKGDCKKLDKMFSKCLGKKKDSDLGPEKPMEDGVEIVGPNLDKSEEKDEEEKLAEEPKESESKKDKDPEEEKIEEAKK